MGHSVGALADNKRRLSDQQEGFVPGHHGTGIG